MKWPTVLFACCLFVSATGETHPGSGISVDLAGTVYFIDTGAGVWRLDRSGVLSKLPGRAYHWLAHDRTGLLANAELPSFPEGGIERSQEDILIASDFPLVVDAKGALYVPHKVDARLRISRYEAGGSPSVIATLGKNAKGKVLGWISGSAVGPDGTFYFTEDHGVWKIPPKKDPVAIPVELSKTECGGVPHLGGDEDAPMFRGIDVDAKGSLYVAVSACRAVIKISQDKPTSVVIRTSGPWSPTGIAAFGNEIYVLEYFHTPSENRREWIPRIRKIAADGKDEILVTVKR